MSSFDADKYYQTQLQHFKQNLQTVKDSIVQKQYHKVVATIDGILNVLCSQLKNGNVTPTFKFSLKDFNSVEKNLAQSFLKDLRLECTELNKIECEYQVTMT